MKKNDLGIIYNTDDAGRCERCYTELSEEEYTLCGNCQLIGDSSSECFDEEEYLATSIFIENADGYSFDKVKKRNRW